MLQNEKRNKVAAVVVTYNRLKLMKQCVESLQKQTVLCDILIINNASTDGTAQWLSSQKDIFSRTTEENIGGAGGFNLGMRWAVESGYDYVWVMDDDALPKPDALEKLLEADGILQGNYGWLSSVALWTDGSECKMNRQKLKKSFYEYSHLLKHGLVQAEQATFISLFLHAETIRQFGLPISAFFLWGDDIEFTRRIAVRGRVPCFVVGQSQVIHAMKINCGSNIALDDIERISRYKLAYRNDFFTYRQEGTRGLVYYFAKCGLHIIRCIRARSHRIKRLSIIFSGMFAGMVFSPEYESLKSSGSSWE